MKRWFAVYTQARMELWARTNLWERDFEVYLPMVLKRRRHARRTDTVPRPLFPRYLFVRADLDGGSRRAIAYARGVAHILCYGNTPSPVPDEIIEEIRAREDNDGYTTLRDELKRGDKVRIVAGTLCDRVGLFDQTTDQRRVIILLDLLGRRVRTRVAAESVLPELD